MNQDTIGDIKTSNISIYARLKHVRYYLPEQVLDNHEISEIFPEWPAKKISDKIGIDKRNIAAKHQTATDLAYMAAKVLFEETDTDPNQIDFILFCTQSPDYVLPTSACLLQDRLNIPTTAGALDFNLGCSGYIYGLSLAKGLVESGQAKSVLLLTGETYTKYLHPSDKSNRSIFGDAASASLIVGQTNHTPMIGPFVFGTDGSGGQHLIVKNGGAKFPISQDADLNDVSQGQFLFMNGPAILNFTLTAIPAIVQKAFDQAGRSEQQTDFFIFHQANKLILDALQRRTKIPIDKYLEYVSECGNTVSSTIPIVLAEKLKDGTLLQGNTLLLCGFGVGLSWATAFIQL